MKMKAYRQRKWIMLAAMTCGTTLQLSTCREDLALFGLRTLFTSFTLPLNQLLRDILISVA
ncbi:MAG: hypothetical protein MI923_11330 [Phycisphaerales bacterium]|nr:hypothetical protein [Phycisphaerales bacterium]